jgi:hypothetical protein
LVRKASNEQMSKFSCAELLEYADTECGFSVYDDKLRLAVDSGEEYRRIYGLKPTH